MSGFFYTILVASVLGAVCTVMAWGGFEKYIKYIASLVCTVLIIAPFRNIDLEKEIEKYNVELDISETESEDLYAIAGAMTEQKAEEYIAQIVFSEFGINAVYADIKIDWECEEPTVEYISVALSEADMVSALRIKDRLYSILGGEVRIVGVG